MKPHQIRYILHKKIRQTQRLSRKTVEFGCLFIGATFVALTSFFFAHLAEKGLQWNAQWTANYPLAVWFVLPTGLAFLAWVTAKYVPFIAGSGIPQVIASISMKESQHKQRLVAFRQTLWKIPLTFLAMLLGASVGREGPSVQVGAAVMLGWANFCRKHNFAFRGLTTNELIAAGAGGGLASAFNAPLAGVIFALEELGRGLSLRWERRILIGVLISGFVLVAIQGNNPYFPQYHGNTSVPYMYAWIILCALICGILGGLFAKLLAKGFIWLCPQKIVPWVKKHPIFIAFLLGLFLSLLGTITQGQTFGTGYKVVTEALDGNASHPEFIGLAKLAATVATYWTGIAGGIFTPSLTIGAGIGANIAFFVGDIIDPRLLALLCIAGFLSAATQSPVTASVVVMEMTGSQPMLIWLLICCIISSFISRQINPKPFYHFAAGKFRQRLINSINHLEK